MIVSARWKFLAGAKDNLPPFVRRVLGRLRRLPALYWAKWHSTDVATFAEGVSPENWKLSVEFEESCKALKVKNNKGINPSGPGAIDLLYFLTLTLKPQVVIETGVAAGWSSLAFLQAMKVNKRGMLYSSDLPNAFAIEHNLIRPTIVPEKLKESWVLDVRGDDIALKSFLEKVTSIDIFHYDSDKSNRGRNSAFNLVRPYLSKNAIVIFDDINENLHFSSIVRELEKDFKVFRSGNKYIGMIMWGRPFDRI